MTELKLFEFSALVRYRAVVLAESREAAEREVRTWEHAWHDLGELSDIVETSVVDERPFLGSQSNWADDAHACTGNALEALKGEQK